jgi:lipopolysaccharide export system protein LptC
VLRNQQGEQLETEVLSWDEQSGTLYTDAPVKITRQDEVLFGNGLTGNSDFSKYEMLNITGRVKLNL